MREDSTSARLTPVVQAVQRALPSVVNIATEEVVRVSDPYEAFFNDFFRGPVRYYRRSIPLGSGVILDSRGLVITNYHVVRRASNIDVRLLDGKSVQGRLVAYDRKNDLALLQLSMDDHADGIQAVPVARPHDLMLGETVVAVGNPFGLGHSVTTGVISAINRHIEEGDAVFDDILQTDAAINPGNSGGPLVNLDGELIGLNLAIRRDAEGIGFALPLARIESVASGWLIPCRFSDGVLGLLTDTEVRGENSLVVVKRVMPGSPAGSAGLKKGDVIVAVSNTRVANSFEVGRLLWQLQPGDTVEFTLEGGTKVRAEVGRMTEEQLVVQRLGLRVQTLTGALSEALQLPEGITGVTISELAEGSELANFGVGRGDVIMGINGRRIRKVSDLAEALKETRAGDLVQLDLLMTRPIYGELMIRPASVRLTLN